MWTRNKITKYISIILVGAAANLVFPYRVLIAETGRPQSTMLNVPYTSQAPLGDWSDPRQADGCEEASLVMAMAWERGGNITPEEAERDIVNLSEYEKVRWGFYQDTSILDTGVLLNDYYGHHDYIVQYGINTENIKNEVAGGRPVIIPINTRLLGGIYRNGPLRHTVIVVGYDDSADTMTINDPYRGGQNFTVPSTTLNAALWDYNSGVHLGLPARMPAMLVMFHEDKTGTFR